jgi:hypothetical protein
MKSLAESSALFAKETKTVDGKPVSVVKGPDINKYYSESVEVKTGETDNTETFASKRMFKDEEFKKDLLESAEFKAQVAGLINNPQGMIATLNNTFKQTVPSSDFSLDLTKRVGERFKGKSGNEIWTLDKLKDPKMLEIAKELYTKSFADYITNNQNKEIYDTDPITGKEKINTVNRSNVTKALNMAERSFGPSNANEDVEIGPKGITKTIEVDGQPVKVIITKDKNGKVTAKKA